MTRVDCLVIAGLGLASLVSAKALNQAAPEQPANVPAGLNAPLSQDSAPTHPGNAVGSDQQSTPSGPFPANPGAGKSAGSPDYPWLFEHPLPIPEVAQPLFTETVNGIPIQYYETTIEPFQQQVYPNLGPANLIGYGCFPFPCASGAQLTISQAG